MAKKLTSFVHVQDPDTGNYVVFGPDDELPGWAAEQITNPSAFEEKSAEVPEPGSSRLSDDVPPTEQACALEELSKAELEELAEEKGVAKSGTKEDIIARLREAGS